MPRELIDIGPGPSDENVAQVGEAGYDTRNNAECKAFIGQIVRAYGEPPQCATLVVHTNRHEFGAYREVAVRIEAPDLKAAQVAWDYAFRVEGDENGLLEQWDDQAKIELGITQESTA